MKKRILIFHSALAPYRLDLFNSLGQIFELKLVFSNRNVPNQNFDQGTLLRQLSVDYSFLDRGFAVLGREVRFGVAKEIAKFSPDVIVSSEFSLLSLRIAYGRFSGRPKQIVWTADSPEIVQAENAPRSAMRRLILPRVDGLILYSARAKEYYQSRFSRLPRIGICPNAQSEGAFRQKLQMALERSGQLSQQLDLESKKVVLYVGRLADVKRIDRLLMAFAIMAEKDYQAMLVIVGDGPQREALANLSRELGIEQQTIFAGHCDGPELHAWFNLGTVFALPSEFEPWGAVVNEALIGGIPVVCSKEVGAAQLITDGDNGTVVDAEDEHAFSDCLGKWLGQAPVIDMTHRPRLRESLMTAPFADAVNGFSSIIDSIA